MIETSGSMGIGCSKVGSPDAISIQPLRDKIQLTLTGRPGRLATGCRCSGRFYCWDGPCNPNDLVADAPPPNPLLAWLAPCHPFTRPTWANVLLLVTGTLQAPGGHSRAASNTPISPSTTGFWAGRSEAGYDHGPRRARRARPHDFPQGAPRQAPLDESNRASQRRDQATHRGSRNLTRTTKPSCAL
jgi:hypothetical protein